MKKKFKSDCGHSNKFYYILPCGHTICEKCSIDSVNLDSLECKCPICDKIIFRFTKQVSPKYNVEQLAFVYLDYGSKYERMGDFQRAYFCYLKGLHINPNPKIKGIAYFLNNNIGYCLNIMKNYKNAEKYCRKAISIDPERHNAFKNLGISLEGVGKYKKAAECYCKANNICFGDSRALGLLKKLLKKYPEINLIN